MAAKGNTGLEYKLLCRLLRRKMTEDYDAYRQQKLRKEAEEKTSLKKAWREVQLCQKIPKAFVDGAGERTTDRKRMEEICKTFY